MASLDDAVCEHPTTVTAEPVQKIPTINAENQRFEPETEVADKLASSQMALAIRKSVMDYLATNPASAHSLPIGAQAEINHLAAALSPDKTNFELCRTVCISNPMLQYQYKLCQ